MRRRQLAGACACLVALAASVPTAGAFVETEPAPPPGEPVLAPAAAVERKRERAIGRYLLAQIDRKRRETWRWERLMRVRRTPASRAAERTNDAEHRMLILNGWKKKAALRKRQAQRPPRLHAWLCIKRHEGSWHDRHPPYWGGLQMDLSFQRTHGGDLLRRKGTADRWTPIEQIWVAERAYRSGLGFSPWPNTARSCALL